MKVHESQRQAFKKRSGQNSNNSFETLANNALSICLKKLSSKRDEKCKLRNCQTISNNVKKEH